MKTNRYCPSCHQVLEPDAPEGLCPECLIRAGFATGDNLQGHTAPNATPVFNPPSIEEMARLFPHLEVVALLGRGGMGAVYKVRQPALDRWAALKILPPSSGAKPGFMERFNREARALAKLNHPGIVAVYEFGQAADMPYFIMEFVDGVNLRQLQKNERVAPREALALIPQICDALQYAHDEGVVHRDIKPENVLVDRKGRVKIADFGIAKITGTEGETAPLTQDQQVVGTPHYMAPEQVEHPQTVDHRADIFSLGVVFYELLTGELPLGKFAVPSKKVRLDVRLDDIVLRALEKEPELRYQQASQVKRDVQTVAAPAGLDPLGASPSIQKVPPSPDSATAPRGPGSAAPFSWHDLLRWPARWLLLVGLLNTAFLLFFRVSFEPASPIHFGGWSLTQFLFVSSAFHQALPPLSLFLVGIILLGAWRMRTLRSFTLSKGAALAAMITPPFFFLGLPIGLWTLARLRHPDAKAAFRQAETELSEPDRLSKPLARSAYAVVWLGMILILSLIWLSPLRDYRIRFSAPPPLFMMMFSLGMLAMVASAVLAPLAAWLALDGLRRSSSSRSLQQVVFVVVLAALGTSATRWLAGSNNLAPTLFFGHRGVMTGFIVLIMGIAFLMARWALSAHDRWWKKDGSLRHSIWWAATVLLCLALWPQPATRNFTSHSAISPTAPTVPGAFENSWPNSPVPMIEAPPPPEQIDPAADQGPQLRFLSWQSTAVTEEPETHAWRPGDASQLTDHEQRLLARLPAVRLDVSATAAGKSNPRFLTLWFSHPSFTEKTYASVSLLDHNFEPLPLAADSTTGYCGWKSEPDLEGTGWIAFSLSPRPAEQIPPVVHVRLQYTCRPWSLARQISAGFEGFMALGFGAHLSGMGQTAKGKAFLSIARDSSQDSLTQLGIMACTKTGRILENSSVMSGGAARGMRTDRFEFNVPYEEIDSFNLMTRPILMAEFNHVLLPAVKP